VWAGLYRFERRYGAARMVRVMYLKTKGMLRIQFDCVRDIAAQAGVDWLAAQSINAASATVGWVGERYNRVAAPWGCALVCDDLEAWRTVACGSILGRCSV
jgi:hypothetical protein